MIQMKTLGSDEDSECGESLFGFSRGAASSSMPSSATTRPESSSASSLSAPPPVQPSTRALAYDSDEGSGEN